MDRRITIERKVVTKDAVGAPAFTWTVLATVYAERRDQSSEPVGGDAGWPRAAPQPGALSHPLARPTSTAPCAWMTTARCLQIVGGPAELGRREFLEFMPQRRISPAGA
jgi:hypothetical protein